MIMTDQIILVLKPEIIASLIEHLYRFVYGAPEGDFGQIVTPTFLVKLALLILGCTYGFGTGDSELLRREVRRRRWKCIWV